MPIIFAELQFDGDRHHQQCGVIKLDIVYEVIAKWPAFNFGFLFVECDLNESGTIKSSVLEIKKP